jgi:hypothetical protein
MADASSLSPDFCRNVSALARTLVAAARSRALCPPDHRAAREARERGRRSGEEAADGLPFSFTVTPDTLPIPGATVTARDLGPVREASVSLRDRIVVEITFLSNRRSLAGCRSARHLMTN